MVQYFHRAKSCHQEAHDMAEWICSNCLDCHRVTKFHKHTQWTCFLHSFACEIERCNLKSFCFSSLPFFNDFETLNLFILQEATDLSRAWLVGYDRGSWVASGTSVSVGYNRRSGNPQRILLLDRNIWPFVQLPVFVKVVCMDLDKSQKSQK